MLKVEIEQPDSWEWAVPREPFKVYIAAGSNSGIAPIALNPVDAVEFANRIIDAAEEATTKSNLLPHLGGR